MSFNDTYYHYDAPMKETLPNGDYYCKIVTAKIGVSSIGNEYFQVEVKFKDFEDVNPNTFTIYEAPVAGDVKRNGEQVTEEDVNRANGRITRFFEDFKITDGDFNTKNWIGHYGWIRVSEQYDANEEDKKSKKFKQLTPIVKQTEAAAKPAPAKQTKKQPQQVQQLQQVVKGEVVQEFSEDIPF